MRGLQGKKSYAAPLRLSRRSCQRGIVLCSEEASFITGTDLPVDGGYLGLGGEGVGEVSIIPGFVD